MSWVSIFVWALFITFVLWVVGTIYRQWIYKHIDRLDEWKSRLEHRPFSEQLSRVKGLNMAGETQHNFERWKQQWEEILNSTLPQVEETLLNIEEYSNRMRFFKCRKLLLDTEQQLGSIEESLQHIVSEIDDLTSSEKHIRENGEIMHERFQRLQTDLQKKSVDLGIAFPVLQEKSKQISIHFQDVLQEQENGNYYQAKQVLQNIEQELDEISEAVEQMPGLIYDIEHVIPDQLQELRQAVEEMKEKGYPLDHTDVEKRLETYEEWKYRSVEYMEYSQVESLKEWKQETLDMIEEMFTRLEQEVDNKSFVITSLDAMPAEYEQMEQKIENMHQLMTKIKQSYSWEEEWEEAFQHINQEFETLNTLYQQCQIDTDELQQAYPRIKKYVEQFHDKHQDLLKLIEQFEKMLEDVRHDELVAQDQLHALQILMDQTEMKLRKSNLPGLPEYVQSGVQVAQEALAELENDIRQIPLDLTRVQHQLSETKGQVESIAKVVETTIQQAQQAEFLIQFANRYRRSYPQIKQFIAEAEQAFRQFEYREALEFIEEGLDQIDAKWKEKVDMEERQPVHS